MQMERPIDTFSQIWSHMWIKSYKIMVDLLHIYNDCALLFIQMTCTTLSQPVVVVGEPHLNHYGQVFL